MRNFIFWLLYVIGRESFKKILTFLIALAVGLLIVAALFSCNPYKKIASDTHRTDSETKLLATICAAEFPPVEYISEGTKTVDSTAYKEAYKALENALKDAGSDVQNLVNLVEQKGQDNDVLRDMLFKAQKKEDSLKAVKQAYKYIPCPETHTRDTAYQKATAQLKVLQLSLDESAIKLAKKEIDITNITAERDKAKDNLKEANKWKWYAIGTWIAVALAGVGYFLIRTKIL